MGADGMELQTKLRDAAGDMPLVGPNTLGFLNAQAKLNVTFYPRVLNPGHVSFLSQSGGIGLGMEGRADDEGMGIAKWIGVGNRVNLEFHTLLEYLKEDPDTRVIGIFTEGCSDARAFMEKVADVTPTKPVLVYKGGLGEDADSVTVTHTGAAAGEERIWKGALRQAARKWSLRLPKWWPRAKHCLLQERLRARESAYSPIRPVRALSRGMSSRMSPVAYFQTSISPRSEE